MLERVLERVA